MACGASGQDGGRGSPGSETAAARHAGTAQAEAALPEAAGTVTAAAAAAAGSRRTPQHGVAAAGAVVAAAVAAARRHDGSAD